jgi:hypothetical protein
MKLLLWRLALGFAGWQASFRHVKRQRVSVSRRALCRLVHHCLSRAWQSWQAHSRRAHARSAAAVRRELHHARRRIHTLEKQAEAAASLMVRERSVHTYQLRESSQAVREMAERLAKAERIAERERLHRADLERELSKAGVRSPGRSPRSPRPRSAGVRAGASAIEWASGD